MNEKCKKSDDGLHKEHLKANEAQLASTFKNQINNKL